MSPPPAISQPTREPDACQLPRDCTFTPTDWSALAPFWYPVAFSSEVADGPIGVKLLDERIVLYRTASGEVTAARDRWRGM